MQLNGANTTGCTLTGGNSLNCAFATLAVNSEIVIVLTSSSTSLAFHCQGPQPDLSIDNGTRAKAPMATRRPMPT